jgi:putative ABC transport system substrate-binding protein
MASRIVGVLISVFLFTPTFAEAQPPAAKTFRIGFLSSTSAERNSSRRAAFQRGLRELGYVEGKNIIIDYRYADGNFEGLPEIAAELVRLKVDVLFAGGAPAAPC